MADVSNAVPVRERRLAGLEKILRQEREKRISGFHENRYFEPTKPVQKKPDGPKWSPT